MANIVKRQLLVDGPRNVVVKLSGILDTSNVAATGEIGASGFSTTIGSKSITFVAGALPPTIGQYVTFSDGTTTFPAGTYITSIVSATVITVNNAALATNAAAAITITGTAGVIVALDPTQLSTLSGNNDGITGTRVIIDKISYNVETALTVDLYWEATANDLITSLVDGNELEAKEIGGLYNSEQTGVTGKLVYSTAGWSGGAVLSYTIILTCRKK